ncbi:Methylated-DNA--protein-cysteine methyltransferase [Poriferisphaera corsica]|uniref:Methylated-DNA--protein-cysteine methyltransferase n=1 Tax=Poriferisphaera corsica TaxID=2528020 RepID=A0A517YYP3_9BACT|nr:MGMT family protein [Poriferisphaera corsica]QDU35326.1 Methylated-DNA--protein-cysteine methyltransferase [Poriferisphaera corsica]
MIHEKAIREGKLTKGMNFTEKSLAICARIPKGKVVTYGDIACKLGSDGASRAVGNAMNGNPFSPDVPCHRVVGSTGKLTGFARGLDKKRAMLKKEGVPFKNDDQVDMAACRHKL